MRILASFIIALVFTVVAEPSFAETARFTGTFFEHIDPTGPFSGLFIGGVGLSPSPKSSGNEIADAISQFKDPNEATRLLENLKRAHGYSAGKVFITFRYSAEGHRAGELDTLCGVTPSNSADPELIVSNQSVYTGDPQGGSTFRNFKKASRAERVRSIARCLGNLVGMPKEALRAAPRPELKSMYVDEASYNTAEATLRKSDPVGFTATSSQYRGAFDCLVASAARANSEMTGDSVVVRTLPSGATGFTSTTLAFIHSGLVSEFIKTNESSDLWGIWGTSTGFSGSTDKNSVEQALGNTMKMLSRCRASVGMPTKTVTPKSVTKLPAPCKPEEAVPIRKAEMTWVEKLNRILGEDQNPEE